MLCESGLSKGVAGHDGCAIVPSVGLVFLCVLVDVHDFV